MFALQQSGQDALVFLTVVAFIIVGGMLRRRRRARMTPTERAADDIRQEIRGLRRDVRNRHFD